MKHAVYRMGRSAYKLWSKFLGIVGDIKIYKWPMFIIYDPTQFKMSGDRIQEAETTLLPGDIILRGYDHYLDGHFIDGDYSHGAICTGKDEITHSVSPKVCTIHPIDFMECDRICILRPKDQSLVDNAVETAKSFIGTPYDFDFNTDDATELYCFELVARCYPGLNLEKHTVKKIFGLVKKNVYLGKSFLLNPNLEIIFEYNPRKGYDSRNGKISSSV